MSSTCYISRLCQENGRSSKVEELCPNLGTFDDMKSSYKMSKNCLQVLRDIETELLADCRSNRRARFNLGKIKAVEKHFIQILIASGSIVGHAAGKSELYHTSIDQPDQKVPIIQVVIRILVNLTLPLECLSDPWLDSDKDSLSRPSLEFNKLQTYLLESKKAFLKYNSGTAIVVKLLRTLFSPTSIITASSGNFKIPEIIDVLETNCEPGKNGQKGDASQLDRSGICPKTDLIMTNNCLVLLRNLLHVPDAAEFYQFEPFRNNSSNNGSMKKEEHSSFSEIQTKTGFSFPKRQCDKNSRGSHLNTSSPGSSNKASNKVSNKASHRSMSSGSSSLESDSDGNSARTSIHACLDNNCKHQKEASCEEKVGQESGLENTSWPSCEPREEWQDIYKKLMWNLLAQGLDGTILYLLASKENRPLTPSIVQLITLLFKDQPANQLQKILCADRVSESSDEDLESDESSSVQVSSSSSFFSDSSLPSSTQSGEANHHEKETQSPKISDKKGHYLKLDDNHQNYTNPSDSGISSSSNTSSDQSIASHESEPSEHYASGGVRKTVSYSEQNSFSTNSSSTGDDEQKLDKSLPREEQDDQTESQQEEVPEASDPENSCCSEAVKQSQVIGSQNSERVTRGEETSGISNGSSEEEQNRVLRKVMKPHHRSQTGTCKTNESDSSEEYNSKPTNVDTIAVNHDSQMNGSVGTSSGNRKGRVGVGFLPIKIKTKCSPSVCFEAALITASHLNGSKSGHKDLTDMVIAPWNKKKVISSKNFPLGVDSYVPTNEDIASLLKDFVVKFLHNSFDELVIDLKDQLLTFSTSSFDPSHLFWLISYFTKLAIAIELDYRHLESIMKTEMIGFLVYEGAMLNEQLELNIMHGQGIEGKEIASNRMTLRKIHLIISSLHELFNVILTYSSKFTASQRLEMESLRKLRSDLSEMADLPQLFLLCIRSFIPTVHSKQFLIEVIITHHMSMVLLEPMYLEGRFDLPLHLKQFATIKIMDIFGKVLQDFKTNSDFVNDCILTMMHHVAGDLMSPDCLFQPIILKTFSLIMESDVDVKDCWGDMIEYIMIRFVRAAKKSPAACIRKMFGNSSTSSSSGSSKTSSSSGSSKTLTRRETLDGFLASKLETGLSLSPMRADRDRLYWLYLQFEQAADPISMIVDSLVEDYDVPVQKKDVLDQLLSKGIINSDEFNNLKGKSNMNDWNVPRVEVVDSEACDKIQKLVNDLSRREMKLQVSWIKDCISKFGAVKLAFPPSDTLVSFKCHALALYSHSK